RRHDYSGCRGSTDPEGQALRFAWDLDGDGTYEAGGFTQSTWTTSFALPGQYTLGVKASDGALEDEAQFTLQVNGVVGWNIVQPVTSADDIGSYCSLKVGGSGTPGIAYLNATSGGLDFVLASDSLGDAWEPSLTIDNSGQVQGNIGQQTTFTGVSYIRAGHLYYVIPSGNPPTLPWQAPQEIVSANVSSAAQILVIGAQSVAYMDNDAGELRQITSLDGVGANWGNPAVTLGSLSAGGVTGLTGAWTSANVQGLAFGTSTSVEYMHTGANQVQVAPIKPDDRSIALQAVDDRPAICFAPAAGGCQYTHGTDSTGTSWSAAVNPAPSNSPDFMALTSFNNKPLIVFHDFADGSLYSVYAQVAEGSLWDAPVLIDDGGDGPGGNDGGQYPSLSTVLQNPSTFYPAVAYYDSVGSMLKYARFY
ncbi:MAG: hypothetical protein M3R04_09800, partial [bacterium]|nr:hypothetical protein [bacterium]